MRAPRNLHEYVDGAVYLRALHAFLEEETRRVRVNPGLLYNARWVTNYWHPDWNKNPKPQWTQRKER